ncbi:DinB family protein [Pollutibacter soli]|uniref:DinB family protein n=1 Tax=Pollutibacter soli TaxID=3034157 RepID=UPI0030137D46
MQKKQILEHFWRAASEKEGWYPPYADALKDVSAEVADWRVEGKASNTIWETVVHVIFYKERLLKRLKGEKDEKIETNDDTFVITDHSPEAWPLTVHKLFSVQKELLDELGKLSEEDLDKPLYKEPIGAQYMNLIVHDAYHTGQIIMILKLKGDWPDHRSFA